MTWLKPIIGIAGPRGEKGEKGERGERGERGLQGLKGLDGNVIQAEEIERLNKEKNKINKIIEELSILLNTKIDSNFIFSMENMGQDIKEYLTSGKIPVVGENSILNENIVKGQLFGSKTDFIKLDDRFNLIDYRENKEGYLIDGANDGLPKENESFFITDYIVINEETQYYYGGLYEGYYCFYGADKRKIEGKGVVDNITALKSPFISPKNARYVRFSGNKLSNKDKCYLSRNDKLTDIKYVFKNNFLIGSNIITDNIDLINKNIFVNEKNIEILKPIGFSNPIKKDKIIEGYYILGEKDGSLKKANGLFATDFCEIESNTLYYRNGIYEGHYAFYDSDKQFIKGGGIAPSPTDLPNPFETPSNAKFVRFTLAKKIYIENAWINTINEKPQDIQEYIFNDNIFIANDTRKENLNPFNFNDNNISVFNKILCIGDSLTEGTFNTNDSRFIVDKKYSYPTYLQKLTGVTTVNLGKGGYTSKRWYEEFKEVNLSGYDCCIIQLGVNDVAVNSANITKEETNLIIEKIIEKIKNENKKIKIFVAGITKSKWYNNSQYIERNESMENYFSGREKDNIYFLNNKKYSKIYDKPYANGHLTALGYFEQAKEYINAISYYINEKNLNFGDIQFSNSDNNVM